MTLNLRWLAGGLSLLLVLLIATVPARVFPRLLPPNSLELSGLSGTLWRGRASRAAVVTPQGLLDLGELNWKLSAASLLLLSPGIELDSERGRQRLHARARLRGNALRLREVEASVDAAIARHWAPVNLQGRINLDFEELVLEPEAIPYGTGRLVWENGGWRVDGRDFPAGTYVALIESTTTDEATISEARVETLDGPVIAEGLASVGGNRYSVDVTISAREGQLPLSLTRALDLFASPRENGYLLRLNGDLSL